MPGSAAYAQGRKLGDEKHYIISVFDCDAAGVLIRAYHQDSNTEYLLGPSCAELEAAGLNRSEESLARLVNSIDIATEDDKTFIQSSLDGVEPPKFVPQGDKARAMLGALTAGDGTLQETLAKGLAELCRAKPSGLDAVQWLGKWLLANNPNQPAVDM